MTKEIYRLAEKTAVVTGGASGIGREVSLLFAAQGARVALLDRDMALAGQAVKEIEGARGRAVALQADVTCEDSVFRALEAAADALGAPDVLVNSAGIFAEGSVTQTSMALWQKIMDVNVTGVYLCMKHVLPYMTVRGSGSIVNIASEAGISAIAGQAAYNTSKAAVVMLSKSAARDCAAAGVRVNCVCPGRVMTPLVQKLLDEAEDSAALLEKLSNDRPVMRMGRTADIAHACLAFATDEMPYATGSVLSVDGGYTL